MVRTRSQTTSVPGPREAQCKEKSSKSSTTPMTIKRDAVQVAKKVGYSLPQHDMEFGLLANNEGAIEHGHIYSFYRPKVQHEGAESLDEVRNTHMLLVPRPPKFNAEMQVLSSGADAVPAPLPLNELKKHLQLVKVGKKHLPDPEIGGTSKGHQKTFWAMITSVGDDLHALEQTLGEGTYETKTRGIRHEEPASRCTRPSEPELGISTAGPFVLVKNPLTPATGPQQVNSEGAEYTEEIMRDVFGKEGGKGREEYGLWFVLWGRGRAVSELEEEESKEGG
ncbi:hypothetical protein C0995_010287 [Termitomyces sp. Mi166|nr:hypothetical protein C0995_010287 [Termitomyces sp. Mi166\